MEIERNPYKDILFGVAVGDALGVPVEFEERQTIKKNPVTGMRGYGTYHLPPGTWSDDSSLTFCLADALTSEFNIQTIGNNFVKWLYQGFWTPRGTVFDVGIATRLAIDKLAKGEKPELAGGIDVNSNGNGSLMRILPLLFYIKDKPVEERYEIIRKVSSLTHGHERSVIACFYYLEFAKRILQVQDKHSIYQGLKSEISNFLNSLAISVAEVAIFDRLLQNDIFKLPEEKIYSSGYVLHTLEASIWSLLTTDTYKDAVLKAVNLGSDTDTTGAVTGGLAGLLYGFHDIPQEWISEIAKKKEIEILADKLENKFGLNDK